MEIPFSGLFTLAVVTNRLFDDLKSTNSDFNRVKESVTLACFVLDRISPKDPNLLKVCRAFYTYIRQIHMLGTQVKSATFFTKYYTKPIQAAETKLLVFIKNITPSLELMTENVAKTNKITLDISGYPRDSPEWIFEKLEGDAETNMWSYKTENSSKFWFKRDEEGWHWRIASEAWNMSPWVSVPEVIVPSGPWKAEKIPIEIQRFIKWLAFVKPTLPIHG